MANVISKSQVDRLGERLRLGRITDSDLRLLDEFRQSFSEPYEVVIRAIRSTLALEPTGRPAKSTSSIVEKLIRESIRLSQMQDIAGCRVIVSDLAAQDDVVASLKRLFPESSVVDRRETPSHGYRAVHIVTVHTTGAVEIQVRTGLQHLWAQLSEILADVIDPSVKYGGGDPVTRELLSNTSGLVSEYEDLETHFEGSSRTLEKRIAALKSEVIRALEGLITEARTGKDLRP